MGIGPPSGRSLPSSGRRFARSPRDSWGLRTARTLFSRASEYDRARDALPWALGIAAWECRTLRRRRERRRERSAPAPERAAEGALSPEEAVLERELRAAAEEVVGTMRPIDVETIISIATGHRAVHGATFRKRVERALARFKLAWRARHGSD